MSREACLELAQRTGRDPDAVVEDWLERAAIREFEGGQPRADAERDALIDLRAPRSSISRIARGRAAPPARPPARRSAVPGRQRRRPANAPDRVQTSVATRARSGTSRDAADRVTVAILDADQLVHVLGGADSFGRCGPGSRWKWLGEVYTPACAAHDAAVRGNLAQGQSRLGAHLRALPKLPAAIGSYVRARVGG
jgi:hypothetical protein